ncbi:hypothetical protein L226DRAFT_576200 [Lentinus tigrinus ALCF2SS1-7]|uniref:uncharacterized protein n=1 Tax=Lentinus tigrinus ALCF2SS1-7 TaxID=1328758 RepID=UPI001165FE09|nr:hypothetical protein L226DRAFT_576200 [Lentinus tigrinus ALCF2SS1-7]
MSEKPNAEDPNLDTSPINVDRHKTRDPSRNPDTDIRPPAPEKRNNAMKDCPKTTVLMRLSQFHEEKLHNAAKGFSKDKKHGRDYAERVWWEFNNAFGTLPKEAKKKNPWPNPTEKVISDAWETVDALHHFVPNHFLHISDEHHDPNDPARDKIDGSFIHDSDKDAITPDYPNWADMKFLVEFKKGDTAKDPFDDHNEDGPDATAKTRRAVRGQIMAYAERVFSYQHRSSVFFLIVMGNKFRVMCWDRSGVAVTEAVNYVHTVEGTEALLEVTYAFSKLSRANQGLDTTATRLLEGSCGWERMDLLANPSANDLDYTEGVIEGDIHDVFAKPEETATYGSLSGEDDTNLHHDPTFSCSGHATPPPVVPVLSHVRKLFRDSLVPGFPRYRLVVEGYNYLVGKHIFIASGMVGRGTRGYVALEWETQRFVFLKDSWRAYYVGVESEGAMLSKLNEEGVTNVPTVVRYGDVYDEPENDRSDKDGSHDSKDTQANPGNVSHSSTEAEAHHDSVVEEGDGESNDRGEGRGTKDEVVERRLEPRLQETVNARYHPAYGDQHVDPNLPPYLVRLPFRHENWAVNGKTAPKTPAKTALSNPSPNQTAKAVPQLQAHTGPNLPAFSDTSTATKAAPPSTARGVKRKFAAMIAGHQGTGLRHMVHSRLIVKEVCLPITAFTSSKQLVRILYGCIIAHAMAWTKCKYMHRDVSAGNLLIYPYVRKVDDKYRICWRGLLADWELAKHASKTAAMQPQRTGTWHFMSAYLLLNPGRPTTIPDELEAYLHVLIYAVLRRMRSNIESVLHFLEAYFSGYSVKVNREVCCPEAKTLSIVKGCTLTMVDDDVTFSTPDGSLGQDHPINKLISDLLKIFHSRYAILRWEKRLAPKRARQKTPAPKRPMTPPLEEDEDFDGVEPEELFGRKVEPQPVNDEEEPVSEPTPKMYDNLKNLDDHALIATIFRNSLKEHGWPQDDVVPDRQNEIGLIPEVLPQAGGTSDQDSGHATTNKAEAADPEDPQDVVMDEVDVKPDSLSPVAAAPTIDPHPIHPDPPPIEAHDSAPPTEVQEASAAPDPSLGRPAKRRRKDPVVKESDGPPLAESSTRRVTRSRSAANAAAATAAVAPAAVVVAAPAVAPAAVVVAVPAVATAAAALNGRASQASTRVTRSKSGKLPTANGRAGATTSRAPTTTRTTRTTTAARTASGTKTRRRGGVAAAEGTQSQPTRRSARSTRRT